MSKTRVFLAAVAALAFASSSVAIADDIVISTGGEGGKYERTGAVIASEIGKLAEKKRVDFDYEIVNSNGTLENVDCLRSGDCHIAMVQGDADLSGLKAKTLYQEYVTWIYNTKHDVEDLSDVEGKHKDYVIVLVDDSGADVTMQSFVREDKGYAPLYENAILADDLYEAVDMVCEGKASGKKVAGMIYVGGGIPKEIGQDFKGCVRVGEATDSDFNDAEDLNGDELYKKCSIPKAKLAGLSSSNTFSDVDTVCVSAMAAWSTDIEDKKLLRLISKGINKAKRRI